ncbi:MAG: DUF3108 domain-containing protein [Lautropia sp.]|nr:DUF3108 domain-containing protein [Lautropia sp.]
MTSILRRQLLCRTLSAAGVHASAVTARAASVGVVGVFGSVLPAAQLRAAAPKAASKAASPSGGETPPVPQLKALPPVPEALSLDFDVFYGDFTGRGVHVAQAVYRLSRQQDQYRLDTEAHATGVLAVFYSGNLLQTSTGVLGEHGFQPQRYTEKRGKRPERQLSFDARTGRVKRLGDAALEYPFPEGTQDRLSIFFQLGLLARGHKAVSKPGQRFILPLAGMKRIDEPHFHVISQEPLRTKAGCFEALHIAVSKPGDPEAPKFDVWLAPALNMMPVRIRVVEGKDNRVIDQVLKKRPAGV